MFASQILHKLLLRNALGNMQTSQEYFITIVYAKFGGQTECIMDNWKIVNYEQNKGVLDDLLGSTRSVLHFFLRYSFLPREIDKSLCGA